MKTVIYTRVSTDTQNHDSQLQELREYCARRGLHDVQEISDTISGTKTSRRGLDQLMALVRRGKVDSSSPQVGSVGRVWALGRPDR